jgi:hypothetical protein
MIPDGDSDGMPDAIPVEAGHHSDLKPDMRQANGARGRMRMSR